MSQSQEQLLEYDLDQNWQGIDEQSNTIVEIDSRKQYQLFELLKVIQNNNGKVMQLCHFTRQWAYIYFQTCQWNYSICQKTINQTNTHHKIIGYTQSNQKSIVNEGLKGYCFVCCQNKQSLYKNLCGHWYCNDCWKFHLFYQMSQFYKNPFPKCIYENCNIKISPLILQKLADNDSSFKSIYCKVLCRSYAEQCKEVKICKGINTVNCDRYFITANFQKKIECSKCGSIMCILCEQQYHEPAQCYDLIHWNNLFKKQLNLLNLINFKTCPNCGQIIQKISGCNLIKCVCLKIFCYFCGQLWQPNHKNYTTCYKYNQIQIIQFQQKFQINNKLLFYQKLRKQEIMLKSFENMFQSLCNFDVNYFKKQFISIEALHLTLNDIIFFDEALSITKIGLIYRKYGQISLYFRPNKLLSIQIINLETLLDKIYKYFTKHLPELLVILKSKDEKLKKSLIKQKKIIEKYDGGYQKYFYNNKIIIIENIALIKKLINYISQ